MLYHHSHHKKAPRLGCFFVVRMKPESTNQHASPPGSYIKCACGTLSASSNPAPGMRSVSGRGKRGPHKVARPCGERRMHRSGEDCPK